MGRGWGADGSSRRTHTVVVEIKYISVKNVVLHTENCKVELLLDCSVTQVEKNIRRLCGKSPKLDDCKRTAARHLKYFRRVHNCNPSKVKEQPKKINEYFEPTEKQQNILASDDGPKQSCLFQTSASLFCSLHG